MIKIISNFGLIYSGNQHHLAKNYLTIDKPIWAEKALKRLLKIDPDHEEAKELMRQCVTAKA